MRWFLLQPDCFFKMMCIIVIFLNIDFNDFFFLVTDSVIWDVETCVCMEVVRELSHFLL